MSFNVGLSSGKSPAWLALWTLLPMAGLTTLFCVLFAYGYETEQENGPMENLQVLFNLLGSCLFFATSFRVTDGSRYLNRGIALFLLTLAVRELDVRPLHIPTLTMLLSGKVRNITFAILWVGAGISFLRNHKPTWHAFLTWLKTGSGRLFLLSALILIAAETIDKIHVSGTPKTNTFLEELIELNGYWMVLFGSWCNYIRSRIPQPPAL
jgi:hypothetical protein